ncbi:hypothetical protein LX36DRAFT_660552, partial [Colletotrichum falcatum]
MFKVGKEQRLPTCRHDDCAFLAHLAFAVAFMVPCVRVPPTTPYTSISIPPGPGLCPSSLVSLVPPSPPSNVSYTAMAVSGFAVIFFATVAEGICAPQGQTERSPGLAIVHALWLRSHLHKGS